MNNIIIKTFFYIIYVCYVINNLLLSTVNVWYIFRYIYKHNTNYKYYILHIINITLCSNVRTLICNVTKKVFSFLVEIR